LIAATDDLLIGIDILSTASLRVLLMLCMLTPS
jgi:hypothetical protein